MVKWSTEQVSDGSYRLLHIQCFLPFKHVKIQNIYYFECSVANVVK